MSYDHTLFLPKTGFPMRAGLTKMEPDILKRWEKEQIYEKVLEKRKGNETFILHDGPPYANGNIHIGTAYNKVLKDFIVKYKSMSGYYSPYIPGWDTHGLPIETEVIKAYKLKPEQLSPIEFRKKCREFTSKYIGTMTEQFKRLGVWGEWSDPYITFHPAYEAKQIEIFGEMAKKQYIYKGLKPVYWCTTCITALADAEVEYHDHASPWIYVSFKVKEGCHKFEELQGAKVVIWTTTPWTIPGNTACALHPDFDYTLFEHSGERYLVATELLDDFKAHTGIAADKILKQYKGTDLEGVVLRHPWIDRDSPIVFAEYVTLETGTGVVHTAPGHGLEDYETGLKYSLDVVSPLDNLGRFTSDVPEFEGLLCHDANRAIIAHLKKLGALLGVGELTHSYPHCWRCKNPVIFRATEQWFTSIDGFRELALSAIDDVSWVPLSSINRIKSMVQNRSDWCISRQRTWGVPIPIFYCNSCGREIINGETLMAVIDLFAREGSNSWWERSAEEILPQGFRCPHCNNAGFTKEKDIMDVWFDSGTSHAAVLETRKELHWPADLYLEGSDQHRGWFQSSLLTAVAARGKAPYRLVLTHGFTVDGDGKKMSKSLGNTIDPEEVIQKYGADILRLWVVASDYAVDVRVSPEILDQLVDAYRKIRNTIRFMLGNLAGFNPKEDIIPKNAMEPIDRWLLHRLQEVTERIGGSYNSWQFHTIVQEILNFCNNDLSSFYLDIVKDRLYCSGPAGERKSAQTAIHEVLSSLLKLLAPILTFTTEEAYTVLKEEIYSPHRLSTEHSIHLTEFPEADGSWLDPVLSSLYETLIRVRRDVLKPIENLREKKVIGHSLEATVSIYAGEDTYDILAANIDELAPLFVVSGVMLFTKSNVPKDCFHGEVVDVTVAKSETSKCSRCWKYEESVGKDSQHPDLCERCSRVVAKYYT
jgi:isoleucyl-tRNA synthetase